jgi:putative intracellular protease/amidase
MPRTIGFVFIEGFADWEFGFLSGSTEWFDSRAVALTPSAKPVTSMGGLRLAGERGLAPDENADLDAVALIGSDGWAAEGAPDVTPLLLSMAEHDRVIGGICAGTLALARAGLFRDKAHTSNGRDWILRHLPDYAGAEGYRDVPHALADGHLVSAPGTAPGTFALGVLEALYPEQIEQIRELRTILGSEYRS